MANEKRMIYLDHALQTVSENYRSDMPKHDLDMLVATRKRLKAMPTVDAVEVERYIELREQYDRLFLEYHELRDNFVSYVCGGIPNPSPFCLNKRRGCCDSHGWCKYNDKCKGFNPAELILDGAKMDGDGNES